MTKINAIIIISLAFLISCAQEKGEIDSAAEIQCDCCQTMKHRYEGDDFFYACLEITGAKYPWVIQYEKSARGDTVLNIDYAMQISGRFFHFLKEVEKCGFCNKE